MLYGVTNENAAVNEQNIICILESNLLLTFVTLKSNLLVEEFQMEYHQLPDNVNPLKHAPNAAVVGELVRRDTSS